MKPTESGKCTLPQMLASMIEHIIQSAHEEGDDNFDKIAVLFRGQETKTIHAGYSEKTVEGERPDRDPHLEVLKMAIELYGRNPDGKYPENLLAVVKTCIDLAYTMNSAIVGSISILHTENGKVLVSASGPGGEEKIDTAYMKELYSQGFTAIDIMATELEKGGPPPGVAN